MIVGLLAGFGICAVIVIGLAIYGVQKQKLYAQSHPVDNRPVMPIQVTFRQAILSNGMVARFKNVSRENLEVVATFDNPTLQKRKSFTIKLSPGIVVEVGHTQGWDFMSGDIINLAHHDYKSLNVKAP